MDNLENELSEEELAEIARVKDLIERFQAIKHPHAACAPLEVANPAAYFRDMIKREGNKVLAEERLAQLEQNDNDFEAEIEKTRYIELRRAEYPSIEEIVEAIIEDDHERLTRIRAKREQIKKRYPKPE